MTHLTLDEFRKRAKRTKKRKPVPSLTDVRHRSYAWEGDPLPVVRNCLPNYRFVLPVELCKRQDEKWGAKPWQSKSDRVKLFRFMRGQTAIPDEPLTGRPLVRCIRFSSVEPDKFSDWAKGAVDCLCRKTARAKERLGIIYDDAPKYAEIEQIWRKAKPGQGFVVIEIWSGES